MKLNMWESARADTSSRAKVGQTKEAFKHANGRKTRQTISNVYDGVRSEALKENPAINSSIKISYTE